MLTAILMSIAMAARVSGLDSPAFFRDAGDVGQVAKTHDGKVVSVADGKLVMSDNDGKNQHNHMITATAKIMLDGKMAKLTDLKAGDSIKVTTAEGEVTMIDAVRALALPK
jgi:hypothetical protein